MTPDGAHAVAAPPSLAAELAAIAGEANVVADPAKLASWAIDGVVPGAAVSPQSAEEVAAVLRLANERGWMVVPAGGMARQTMGATPERVDVLLRTDRMAQLEHYDPADLTLGAGAGLTLAALDARLAEHGQMLPLDPGHAGTTTLGGLLATAAQGPLRHAYGGVRDYCIGVRFVTGDGVIAKAGGRVVKNVAGYDLMKLLIGSHGTLGVIVGANFKVVPRPRQTRTFVSEFDSAAEALRFRDVVLRTPLTPMCLELVSPHAQEYLSDPAPARDPDDHMPGAGHAEARRWMVLLRAAGSDAVLARYRRELGAAVARELDGAEEAAAWVHIEEFGAGVVARHRNAMMVQISGTIQDVGPALAALQTAALDNSFLPAVVGRCGVGAMVAAFAPLAVDPLSAVKYAAAVSSLRAGLGREGSAVVLRCPLEAKPHFDLWGPPSGDVASMRALRRTMDPRGVLNRGRFLV